ncbi:hypothetical protein Q1695_003073 [Nippostrongylus brasiliensis]|nr:hypothetical protein Q1695_003073 [Nippostrongylus brasiliensis]
MPNFVLYSYWRSSCAWRVRIALNLKKAEYEYKTVNLLSADALNDPTFRAVNPAGKVPALVVDGQPITESLAIIEYLDEIFPDVSPLLPQDPIQRAQARAIALQITAGIQPIQNLRVLKHVNSLIPNAGQQWAKHWLSDGLRDLENMLSRTSGCYAVGNSITVADLCIPSIVYNARRNGVEVEQFPTLCKVNDNLSKIPEFIAAEANNQPDAQLNA